MLFVATECISIHVTVLFVRVTRGGCRSYAVHRLSSHLDCHLIDRHSMLEKKRAVICFFHVCVCVFLCLCTKATTVVTAHAWCIISRNFDSHAVEGQRSLAVARFFYPPVQHSSSSVRPLFTRAYTCMHAHTRTHTLKQGETESFNPARGICVSGRDGQVEKEGETWSKFSPAALPACGRSTSLDYPNVCFSRAT